MSAFHVELRQFPHAARAFNLTAEELQAGFVGPWLVGAAVHWDDRRWDPGRAKLTIYEADELRPDQIGMGRGWGNVTKSGREVTSALLERGRSTIEDRKAEVLRRCAAGPLALDQLDDEQAVLELLREGRLRVSAD